ncbi:GNAT family N-acetyltransferase [Kitasatospora sp. NPDC048540]|uniref:GNAT family N-acetyltransferase n=1 Tax=unclassified Kitasatospora TaxID=2633591 RepID=UPI00053A1090|nr:GNAT family N-acetyltransferase [Kitasatospora sp. MBT63]
MDTAPDLVIRRALPEDLDAAGALSVEVYVGEGYSRPDGPYPELLRDTRRRAEEAELLVAVDPAGGAVLGSVTFAPGGNPWADIAAPHEGEIRMLAVARAARGRGAGSALVRAAMARSRELGLTGMAFSTRPAMTAAHRVYERLGFRRSPERDWEPAPGIDVIVYSITF